MKAKNLIKRVEPNISVLPCKHVGGDDTEISGGGAL